MSKLKLEQAGQASSTKQEVTVVGSSRFSRKFKLWAVSILAVLIIGGGVAGWEYHARSVVSADNRKYAELQTETDSLSTNNHFDKAAALWVSYAANTSNRTHRGAAYASAAELYLDGNQFSQAYAACKKAEVAVGITYGEVELAAEAAEGLGKKATAIQYYQDAIRLIPASTSYPQTQKYMFNLDIQRLRAKS